MNPPGGLRGVLEAARALRAAGQAFALALVTDTEGSTYRKAGALAVVASDGGRTGTISGGCLEPALVQLCQQVIADGRAACTVFDTRGDDDLLFGSGSGCRGRMRVLAWPLPGAGDGLLDAVLAADEAGRRLAVAVAVDAEPPGWRVVYADAPATTGEVSVRIAPVPRVLVLGAGPEAAPLLALGHALGWHLQVADHREGLLADPRLPASVPRLSLRPAAALAALPRPADAVLVMTHLASADLEALRALADTAAPYVGLLGPPGRRDELLAELDIAARQRLQPRLRAPVGLFLGGEGPEAIALAIAADLQRHFHAPP
ncbi:MAG TPA: XdhC family protein [Arenimonas sp.]|uniref:XdhC family protein n=1 Tax=Arenimonas sp. TaxID=1872635 RepID=UPI002D7E87AF|nr:XdhC family protein [Arenimonas sp.]HEU0152316.1 XdhC family protein [Arenimonas sp.]